MPGHRLLWRVYFGYLAIILLATGAVCLFAFRSVERFYADSVAKDLEARARLALGDVEHELERGRAENLPELARELGALGSARVTIIAADGRVIGDSEEDPAGMDNHGDRPEVRAALEGQTGRARRYSYTRRFDSMYVAVPLAKDGKVEVVVRTGLPLEGLRAALYVIYRRIVLGSLAVAALAGAFALYASRRVSKPLVELSGGAEKFARGELDHRLRIEEPAELREVAAAFNRMAADLGEKTRGLESQRRELESVLASMQEGVIAVDSEERVIRINEAAARLVGMGPEEARGRGLREVVRNSKLASLLSRVFSGGGTEEEEITLLSGEARQLSVTAGALRDADGREIGALLVLNDVTRMKRLESMRRDFVANVSHELRTPVTSIKGFVETLRDGAMNEPENIDRFLAIIARQAERLGQTIEDLLSLSQIEREEEMAEIKLEEASLRPTLEASILACEPKAAEKQIAVELACAPELSARLNEPLLEHAVMNLIDNAVKYSEPGSRVRVRAEVEGARVLVRVQDEGCGIKKEHLPRLFERFYRVDKARSRKLGGTGLGLAIVKHIAQAHGGSVSVESAPGKGSTFTISLPAA